MSENSVSSDLVVALVKKACDGLAVLATSVDEINSLKRLTVLLELQKSWESKTDLPGQEKHEDRYQHHSKDNDRENNIADIVVCHDCGQSELSIPQKSPPPFICSQCGVGFQKCLTLMRHLLTHNTSNNFNNMTNHNNGVDSGHVNNNNGSPLAILSQDRNKDFYIFMDSSGNKETGSDMNVKLESAFGNMYEEEDDEDDEDEEEDDDDDYNDNGDDEDDDYSRESQNKNNSGILNNAQSVRNNMESESSNGLKKEENNSSGHSNESYNDKGGSSSKTQLGSRRYSFFPKLECPACGRNFSRTNSLKNHMAIHTSGGTFYSHAQRNSSSSHSGRYKRSRSPLDNDDRPALCCDCGKQFVNLKRLKIHALSHSAPERFSCNKCPLKFSVAASLKRHLQRHSGVRPHVCSKCGKSFVRSDELTAHERLHSNRNRFPCPVCGKGFTRSIDMVRHQSCHETTKPYQCNQCDKSFVRHDFLKKHESTHLSRACPFCKDVFDNRRNITLHIKKEHPDKSVEDLFNISQSKLVVNPEAYNEAQSIVSILEPNNLFEVPRSSLQIEFSPLVDDSISTSVSLANPHQLIGQSVEREEFS